MRTLFVTVTVFIAIVTHAQLTGIEKGEALFDEGKYTQAQQIFERALHIEKDNANLHYLLGKALFMQKKYTEAESQFNAAIAMDDSQSDYYLLLGSTYTQQLQNVSMFQKAVLAGKSLLNYQEAVEKNPENVTARFYLANYYIHAPAIAGGSISRATEQANAVLKLNAEKGHLLFAQIYAYEKDYDLAIASYKKALKINNKNTDTYYSLGMLYQSQKNYPAALQCFESAVKVDTSAYGSLYQIGRTAVFSGKNLETGIRSLKKYIDANPKGAYPPLDGAYWRLGMLYEKQGKINLAKAVYQKAVELNPDSNDYKEALANVEK